MKPVDFTYHRATGVDDALERLAADGDGVKLIGGGQSLGPMLNLRLARPRVLVDISSIEPLRRVETTREHVIAGAAATHGAAYFRELWAAAAEARPAADFEGILDCGGAAGHAMAALAEGIARLRLDAPDDVLGRVRDMAAKSGARLDESDDAALDFSTSNGAALRDWLRGG